MRKRKPILLIDQDDVLAEYIKAVTLTYNKKYNANRHPKECDRWDLVSIFGENILEIMHDPQIFRELEPVKDAIETFKRLYESNLFEMYIVTAAQPSAVEAKHEWIKYYMPFLPQRNVIYCLAKEMIKGDYLFDDGLHNVEAFKKAGGTPILFDRPHNRKGAEDYIRVKGWLEFETFIMNTCYPELSKHYFSQFIEEREVI